MFGRKSVALVFGLGLAASVAVATPAVASGPVPASAAPVTSTAPLAPAPSGVTPAVQDYEWDTAVAGTPPSLGNNLCTSRDGAKACFEPNGDRLWVEDTKSDGHSATASWENWLIFGSPTGDYWDVWRHGSCVNKLGSGRWGVCDKNFTESQDGSYLNLAACVYDSADGTWYGCTGFAQMWNYN